MINSKCIRKSHNLILVICIHYFHQDALDFMVRELHLLACLWMITCGYFVLHSIFSKKVVEWLVAKVTTSITNNNFWHSKPCKDILLEKIYHHLVIIMLIIYCFQLFWHIAHSYQNIGISKRWWNWSNEINPPYIKQFNYIRLSSIMFFFVNFPNL